MQCKWVVSPDYRTVIDALKAARIEVGVSQCELAQRLNKHPSFVNKVELIERRLDVLEFIAIARALGVDPAALLGGVAKGLPDKIEF